NVLWSGKVLETTVPEDEHTKGVIEFNEFIKNDDRIEKVMLPIRDGLTLMRKL
ncbi:MAG: methyltransferase, partial [Marinilabiliales bacterium]